MYSRKSRGSFGDEVNRPIFFTIGRICNVPGHGALDSFKHRGRNNEFHAKLTGQWLVTPSICVFPKAVFIYIKKIFYKILALLE